MSTHKTSASALASLKPTSHVLPEPLPGSSTKKRKKKEDLVNTTDTDPDDGSKRSTKKAKTGFHDGSDVSSTPVTKLKPEKKRKTKGDKDPMLEAVKVKRKSEEKEAARDKKGKKKRVVKPVLSESEDQDEAAEGSEQNSSSSDPGEDDGEYVPPVHESLARAAGPNSASSSKKSRKYAPSDETPDQRDSRTIFVGNVPSRVMTTKVRWRHISLSKMLLN